MSIGTTSKEESPTRGSDQYASILKGLMVNVNTTKTCISLVLSHVGLFRTIRPLWVEQINQN